MGIFDSDFNIEEYIRQRIPELDRLENRELFKAIVGNSVLELYKHVKEEYDALEQRVFNEAPRAERMPDLITCVIDAERYDVTDAHMIPMFPDDLNRTEVNDAEMIESVKSGNPFRIYTCMIRADYLELKKLSSGDRRFKGTIENEYGETPAEFILKPCDRYIRKAQELYKIAKLNYLPWRSINTSYLYKLFDVYVVSVEEWDDQLEVQHVTPEFDEFGERILYNPLPLWNVREVVIKGNSYPQPAVDRKYYEHYLYQKQFRDGNAYLLRRADTVIRNIRRENGDMYIILGFLRVHSIARSKKLFQPVAQQSTERFLLAQHDRVLRSTHQDPHRARSLLQLVRVLRISLVRRCQAQGQAAPIGNVFDRGVH